MKLRSAPATLVIFAVTTVLAQANLPAARPEAGPINHERQPPSARRTGSIASSKAGGVRTPASLHDRVQDLEGTITQMQAVLKQMHAKSASRKTKDTLADSNLQMWELMVNHLDKQLQELKVAEAAREDFEARRAAMYKQADAKAEAETRAARAAQSAPNSSVGQVSNPGASGRAEGGTPGQTVNTTAPPPQSAPLPPN